MRAFSSIFLSKTVSKNNVIMLEAPQGCLDNVGKSEPSVVEVEGPCLGSSSAFLFLLDLVAELELLPDASDKSSQAVTTISY